MHLGPLAAQALQIYLQWGMSGQALLPQGGLAPIHYLHKMLYLFPPLREFVFTRDTTQWSHQTGNIGSFCHTSSYSQSPSGNHSSHDTITEWRGINLISFTLTPCEIEVLRLGFSLHIYLYRFMDKNYQRSGTCAARWADACSVSSSGGRDF